MKKIPFRYQSGFKKILILFWSYRNFTTHTPWFLYFNPSFFYASLTLLYKALTLTFQGFSCNISYNILVRLNFIAIFIDFSKIRHF